MIYLIYVLINLDNQFNICSLFNILHLMYFLYNMILFNITYLISISNKNGCHGNKDYFYVTSWHRIPFIWIFASEDR